MEAKKQEKSFLSSQLSLAKRLGVNEMTVVNWETKQNFFFGAVLISVEVMSIGDLISGDIFIGGIQKH